MQSGGERAVAIAVYSLSLQHITNVPFRCVDEINQGMDPRNERKIFEMLVEETSKSGRSQYFFVTPKVSNISSFISSFKKNIFLAYFQFALQRKIKCYRYFTKFEGNKRKCFLLNNLNSIIYVIYIIKKTISQNLILFYLKKEN